LNKVQANNLPAELRESGLFCCWRYETRSGTDKPTKVPYNPRTGGGAQSTNPGTFAPLSATLEAAERGQYDGIGAGIFGSLGAIDIDHCLDDNGRPSELARDIAGTIHGYTERSPSGKGLRILFTVSDGFQYDKARYYISNQRLGLEVYIAGATQKYVTVTGDAINPGYPLEERGEQLAAVLEKYMVRPRAQTPTPQTQTPIAPVELDDLALIERAKRSKNGVAFTALWAGDTTGCKSRSEADIAFCNMLAFWTNKDAARMDSLFRQSGLMREKWDRPQSGSTYGALTIQNAISTTREGYDPQIHSKPERVSAETNGTFEPFEPPNTSRLPAFPMGSLPPVLRNMAASAAENLQVDPGMTAVAGLAVAALCVQGKYIINPKPGWVEPLNLYASVIARPSERKTPAQAVMTRPLYAFEKEENQRRAPLIDEYLMKRDVLKKKIFNVKEAVAKPTPKNGKAVSFDDITELQYELSDLEREAVKPLRLLADDTTPEALVSLMAANDGKMGIISDEGGIFDTIAGKYSSGKVNMDVFLKAYTGSYLRVDRKGREPEIIERPTLTMLLMVQPAVLEAIMTNDEFAGRGLLARYLYAFPPSLVGHRRYKTPPVPQDTECAYAAAIHALLSIPDMGEARTIKVSPEADKEAERFFNILEPRLADDFGDLDDLEGWATKYHGQIMRIAGVIHCCLHYKDSAQVPVSLDTMKAAQIIGEYFLEHTRAAFQIMGLTESRAIKDAKYILKRISATELFNTTKRDLFQQCNGRLHGMEEMESGLKILIDRGYIRVDKVKTGGRPTEKIIFNPEAKVQKVQKVQKPA